MNTNGGAEIRTELQLAGHVRTTKSIVSCRSSVVGDSNFHRKLRCAVLDICDRRSIVLTSPRTGLLQHRPRR